MTLHTEIEIARSPEEVRKVFLDFPTYPTWTQGFIRSITPLSPAADPSSLQPGSKLRCVLQGMTITPTIQENSPSEFRWRGMLWGISGLFTGEHSFRFEPSKTNPGETTFVQAENFSGILSFLIKEGTGFARTTREGFEGFNGDLKRRVEGLE